MEEEWNDDRMDKRFKRNEGDENMKGRWKRKVELPSNLMSNVSNHHEQQNTVSEIALQIFLYRNTTIHIIPDSCSVFARNSFSCIKVAGANHLLHSSAKLNNLQSFTSIPSTCLHDIVCRDKASFIFLYDNCLHNIARVSMNPQQQWPLFM
jgi:hypothetical protein